jgi:hypothetical protein
VAVNSFLNPNGSFTELLQMLPMKMSKQNLATIALLIVMICAAFVMGLKTIRSLEWPGNSDHHRDIATAQTMADGYFTSDSNYVDKKIWYNPLIPGLIALLNNITGLPIPKLSAQVGAYLNLLAPISFSLMVWILFGKRSAIVATLGFLFLINAHRGIALATYSPWLFPVTFMQSFFYLLIALLFYAVKNKKGNRFYFLLGALTGITFLGHAEPVLLIAFIVTFLLSLEFKKAFPNDRKTSSEILKKYIIFVFSSILFAFPLIYFVAFVYGMKTLNYAPSTWLGSFTVSNLIADNVNAGLFIAGVGLIALLKDKNLNLTKNILSLWIIGALVFLIYTIAVTYFSRKHIAYLPPLVPWLRFYFYLKAAETVLFGYGFIKLFELLTGLYQRLFDSSRLPEFNVKPVVIALAVTVMLFPSYINRKDFLPARKSALMRSQKYQEIAAYQWIRKNTKNNDVFLATDYLSLFVVNPAARKTVCTKQEFSNPYVDFRKRNEDRNNMFTYLREDRQSEFYDLAESYSLDYVISNNHEVVTGLLKNKNFKKAFESLGLYIFERKTTDINGMLLGNSDMIL